MLFLFVRDNSRSVITPEDEKIFRISVSDLNNPETEIDNLLEAVREYLLRLVRIQALREEIRVLSAED